MKKWDCKCGNKMILVYEMIVDKEKAYIERKGICIKCGKEVIYKTHKNKKEVENEDK